jgi:hypothetical protein
MICVSKILVRKPYWKRNGKMKLKWSLGKYSDKVWNVFNRPMTGLVCGFLWWTSVVIKTHPIF